MKKILKLLAVTLTATSVLLAGNGANHASDNALYNTKANSKKGVAGSALSKEDATTTALTKDGVEYDTVTSPYTGKVWLDRNLGASQICTTIDDTSCFGDYFQWGRSLDSHENFNSTTTRELATDVDVGHGDFITSVSYSPFVWTTADWDGTQRVASLKKTDGSSICPVGFRVPSLEELQAETSGVSEFENFLKLPTAGWRSNDGKVNAYPYGIVLTTSIDAPGFSHAFFFSTTVSGGYNSYRSNGISVRCISE